MRWPWQKPLSDNEREAKEIAQELRDAWAEVLELEADLKRYGYWVRLNQYPNDYYSNNPSRFKVEIEKHLQTRKL